MGSKTVVIMCSSRMEPASHGTKIALCRLTFLASAATSEMKRIVLFLDIIVILLTGHMMQRIHT